MLLIMDEATNAMDSIAEAALLDALQRAGIAVLATAQLDSRLNHHFGSHIVMLGDASGPLSCVADRT